MSKEVVSYMLSGMDNMKSLQVQLILQCAPFLKGIKIACILNITEENSRELYEILEGTGIKFKNSDKKSWKMSCIFVPARESFSRYLKRTDVRGFLGSYGYEGRGTREDAGTSLETCLSVFRWRNLFSA